MKNFIELPAEVYFAGKFFDINTDWQLHAWIETQDFNRPHTALEVLNEVYGTEATAFILEHDLAQRAFTELFDWHAKAYECMQYGNSTQKKNSEHVFDLQADRAIIACDFMRFYNIDLSSWSSHWYLFVTYLFGLMRYENSLLAQAITARLPIPKGAKGDYRKSLVAAKRAWALPLTEDERIERLKQEF